MFPAVGPSPTVRTWSAEIPVPHGFRVLAPVTRTETYPSILLGTLLRTQFQAHVPAHSAASITAASHVSTPIGDRAALIRADRRHACPAASRLTLVARPVAPDHPAATACLTGAAQAEAGRAVEAGPPVAAAVLVEVRGAAANGTDNNSSNGRRAGVRVRKS